MLSLVPVGSVPPCVSVTVTVAVPVAAFSGTVRTPVSLSIVTPATPATLHSAVSVSSEYVFEREYCL